MLRIEKSPVRFLTFVGILLLLMFFIPSAKATTTMPLQAGQASRSGLLRTVIDDILDHQEAGSLETRPFRIFGSGLVPGMVRGPFCTYDGLRRILKKEEHLYDEPQLFFPRIIGVRRGKAKQFHLFQGLWTDPTTGLSYARNRWYDARTASWLSEDPMGAVDSPNLYAFVGWGPQVGTDPLGLEKIVVSGADPQHYGKFKYKFIEPAIKRIKEYAARADDEQVTWAIFAGGYSLDDLEVFRKFDDEHSNIGVVFIFSKKGLVTYLNSKGTAKTKLTEARSKDRITELSVFSHGLPNTLEFYYGQKGSKEELGTLTVEGVKLLDPKAFDQPIIDLFSCGSAYYSKEPGEELSDEEFRKRLDETLAGVIAERTKGIVSGFVGESSYHFQYLHPGESYLKRWWDQGSNGFNIEGSKGYPGPGNGTGARGTYVPNFGKVVIDRRQR